eukprot:747754-Hanusia_phi.AAC.2
MSSAGVYKKSSEMPHMEDDAVDPKSRHKGKLETEAYRKIFLLLSSPLLSSPLFSLLFSSLLFSSPLLSPLSPALMVYRLCPCSAIAGAQL